jgi:hypothetical protein
MMEWTGPSLVEHKLTTKAGNKDVIARLGFPHPSDKAPNEWACDFQLAGWKDGRIRVAYGVDGMQALVIAASEMRRSLDDIKGLLQGDEAHDLVFPRFVPISYGLEFHRQLCAMLDEEIEKKEREIERRTSRGPSAK